LACTSNTATEETSDVRRKTSRIPGRRGAARPFQLAVRSGAPGWPANAMSMTDAACPGGPPYKGRSWLYAREY
jgi:hypothetical protein